MLFSHIIIEPSDRPLMMALFDGIEIWNLKFLVII